MIVREIWFVSNTRRNEQFSQPDGNQVPLAAGKRDIKALFSTRSFHNVKFKFRINSNPTWNLKG